LIRTLAAACLLSLATPALGAGEGAGWQALPLLGCLPADGGPPLELFVWGAGLDGRAAGLEASCEVGRVEGLRPAGRDLLALTYAPAIAERAGAARDSCRLGRRGGAPGEGLTFQLPLCLHPAGRITLRAEPDHLLAGVGQKALLDITAVDVEGRPWPGQPLEVTVNIGHASEVQEVEPGRYRAEYLPPDDPFPQVAVIMVANPRGASAGRVAVGRAVLPITARIELPGRTEAGTRMEMSVAGRAFGPVVADRAGAFRLPILVPPGFGTGQATSTDRAGNRRQRVVDLFLPEVNQLGLWAHPRRLPADGRSRANLLITTVDRYGNPADLGGAELRARRGTVSAPRRLDKGLLAASYTAPEESGAGEADLVEVRFPGGKQRSAVEIALLPGPAARLALQAPMNLPADGSSPAEVRLQVTDARGHPVAGKSVHFEVSEGAIEPIREESPGLHLARLIPPSGPARWQLQVRVEVRDAQGRVPARILAGAPGWTRAGAGPGGWLAVAVVDAAGLPVPAVELVMRAGPLGEGRATTDELGWARFHLAGAPPASPAALDLATRDGQLGARVILLGAPDGSGRLLAPGQAEALPMSAALHAETEVQLYPPCPLRLSLATAAGAGPGELVLRVSASDAAGTPVRVEALRLTASEGELSAPEERGPGRYEARWRGRGGASSPLLLSATDLASGVGASLEVRVRPDGPAGVGP